MRPRLPVGGPWGWVDAFAHLLYVPTMRGRRSARARWHHRVHLIPRRLLRVACDRFDEALVAADGHFGEDVDVVGPDGFGCAHVQLWSNNPASKPTSWCGCDLQPLWRPTFNSRT